MCLLVLFCRLIRVQSGRFATSPFCHITDAGCPYEHEEVEVCYKSRLFGCSPYQICDDASGACTLQSDAALAEGAATVASRMLARAKAFNATTWYTIGILEFTRFTRAVVDFHIYGRVLMQPMDRPQFLAQMKSSRSDLTSAMKTFSEAFHRNGIKAVDLGAFTEYVEESHRMSRKPWVMWRHARATP